MQSCIIHFQKFCFINLMGYIVTKCVIHLFHPPVVMAPGNFLDLGYLRKEKSWFEQSDHFLPSWWSWNGAKFLHIWRENHQKWETAKKLLDLQEGKTWRYWRAIPGPKPHIFRRKNAILINLGKNTHFHKYFQKTSRKFKKSDDVSRLGAKISKYRSKSGKFLSKTSLHR